MKWLMKILIAAALIALVVLLVNLGCSAVRGGYESAPYKVLKHEGDAEVRDYPSLTVAQTSMQNADNSFMRLFRYIDGQNANKQKIAMTTPVFFSGQDTNRTMAFVMPENLASDQLPAPKDNSVSIQRIPGGKFAVIRFSGGRNTANQAEAAQKLATWLAKENLSPVGEPMFAYFDPPWTPTFLRRNEIMIRLAPSPSTPTAVQTNAPSH